MFHHNSKLTMKNPMKGFLQSLDSSVQKLRENNKFKMLLPSMKNNYLEQTMNIIQDKKYFLWYY